MPEGSGSLIIALSGGYVTSNLPHARRISCNELFGNPILRRLVFAAATGVLSAFVGDREGGKRLVDG